MKCVKVKSDYSPDAYMKFIINEDGDIMFKTCGAGEMRITTSGGQFHGEQLVAVCDAAKALMEALSIGEQTKYIEK